MPLLQRLIVELLLEWRLPPDTRRVHHQTRPLVLGALEVLLHQFGRHADHVLALPIFDQIQRLESLDDVLLGDGRHGREVFDGESPPEVAEDFEEDPTPVGPVGEFAQIREGFLRATRDA